MWLLQVFEKQGSPDAIGDHQRDQRDMGNDAREHLPGEAYSGNATTTLRFLNHC